MSNQSLKCVVVSSTNGSVMNELLKNNFFKENIFSIVSDRECGAIEKAEIHQISSKNFNEKDKKLFCKYLLDYLEKNNVDYVISFFTKLFVGDILEVYENKIINLHPSLLPAFKGMNGFKDAVNYGVRYIGSTVHLIDEEMDEGKIILQSITPFSSELNINLVRHKIFEQQCKSLLQVIKWLAEGRINIENKKVSIQNAKYDDFEYSPNLDFEDAITLKIPFQELT